MQYDKLAREELIALSKKKNITISENTSNEEMAKLLAEADALTKEYSSADAEQNVATASTEAAEPIADVEENIIEDSDDAAADEDEEYVPITYDEVEEMNALKQEDAPKEPETAPIMEADSIPVENSGAKNDTTSQQAENTAPAQNTNTPESQNQNIQKVKLRRQGERLYQDPRNKILTVDAEETKELSERERAIRDLYHSMEDKTVILKGTVYSVSAPFRMGVGTDPETGDDIYKTFVYAYVMYHGVKVMIPSPLFLPNEEDIEDSRLLLTMQRMVGAEIDFVVQHHQDETATEMEAWGGNRLDAMRNKRREFWFGRKRRRGNIIYRINEGDIVEARVVAVHTKDIVVEVFGQESRIFLNELAYEYVNDASERFISGERIKVKILSIDRDMSRESLSRNGYFGVEYTASVKQTTTDPRLSHFYEYEINQTCRGIVTRVMLSDRGVRFIVNVAGEVDVYCWVKQGIALLPEEGDSVSLRIARLYEDTQMISGTITHVYQKRLL